MCEDNPLLIRPLSPTEEGSQAEVGELVSAGGRHRGFCILRSGPDDDHGAWCVSEPVGRELSALTEAGRVNITVDVAAPFLRGRYSRATAERASAQRYVRLLVERHVAGRYERCELYLDPGDAVVLGSNQASAALSVAGFTGFDTDPR